MLRGKLECICPIYHPIIELKMAAISIEKVYFIYNLADAMRFDPFNEFISYLCRSSCPDSEYILPGKRI